MELEIDDRERRAIERSLAERRSRLIERAEDTTLTAAQRRAVLREQSAMGRCCESCDWAPIEGAA